MSCICGGRGLIRVCDPEGADPDLFGVCLCDVGMVWRNRKNANRVTEYPAWMVWCAQHQVAHERIVMVEDVFDAEQMALIPRADQPSTGPSIAEAMRTGKRPRL